MTAIGVVAAWTGFAGTHLALSHPPIRARAVRVCGGEAGFNYWYTATAVATFVPVVFTGAKASRAHVPARGVRRLLGHLLKAAGATVTGLAIKQPSPSGMTSGPTGNGATEPPKVEGIIRITRHPLFGGVALYALGNAVTATKPLMALYWAAFPAFWFGGSLHQDYRQKLDGKRPARYFEETSLLPFQAIHEGKQSLDKALQELDWGAGRKGFGVYVVAQVLKVFVFKRPF